VKSPARCHWLVPIADKHATITIDDGFACPAVHLEMPETQLDVMTAMEACQLGQALQDAALVAAGMKAKLEGRKRR
jgi:hypothetical protein